MYNENRLSDRRDLANVHSMQVRSFLVDIALFAVVMILLSIYSASLAPLALAFVMISVAAFHAS